VTTVNLGSLDQPEPGESAAALSGTSLSKPFFGNGGSFNRDRLLDGRGMVRTNDEYKTSIALCAVLEILAENQSTQLIEWLVSRSSRAPATRCDNVIRASLPNEFNGFSAQFWQTSRNHWKAMLTATNPAYRLIAMRNASFFETDAAVLLSNYQSGLNETNTLLQNAAFEGLKRIATPAARAALQTFLNQQRSANDGTMPEGFDINAAIQEYLNPPAP
jgi:hypothetical protein